MGLIFLLQHSTVITADYRLCLVEAVELIADNSGGGMINIHTVLYRVRRKDGHIDGSYMQKILQRATYSLNNVNFLRGVA